MWQLTMIYVVAVVTVGWAMLVAAGRDAERQQARNAEIAKESERRAMLARIVEEVRQAER